MGQVPPQADADFDDGVGRANKILEFFRTRSSNPRDGWLRDSAFSILVTPPRFAGIKLFGRAGHRLSTAQMGKTDNDCPGARHGETPEENRAIQRIHNLRRGVNISSVL